MADPRLAAIHRVGTNPEKRTTYKIDGVDIVFDATKAGGSASVGLAVTKSGNGIVRLCGDGQPVDGQLYNVEADGACGVITQGVVLLPAGNAQTLTAGSKIVGALGAASARGYIRNAAANGADYAEAAADDTANAKHSVIDASVSTAIEVELGA